MKRRAFLATALAVSLPRSAFAAGPRAKRAFVASDVDPLRRVLVHFPGPETQKPGFLHGEPADPPGRVVVNLPLTTLGVSQHRTFASRLAAGGAEVVSFKDALDDAIQRCNRMG